MTHNADDLASDTLHRTATHKAKLHLIPLLCMIYLLSYLDRTNVSLAQLRLRTDLGISASAYGFGAGIFFLSYALLEVPSNLAAYKFGPRLWIVRIAITWGLISAAMMFIQGQWTFYAMRVLLGVAEAGLFPAMMYMITLWFAQNDRSIVVGWVYLAPAAALLIGNPLGGALMQLDGLLGLHGWQWLFLVEGIPSALVGVLLYFKLPERPRNAKWLSHEEAQILEARSVIMVPASSAGSHMPLRDLKTVLREPYLVLVGLIYFFNQIAFIGLIFFTPSIIHQMNVQSPLMVGILSSAVGVGSVVGVLLIPRIQRVVQRDCLLLAVLTLALIIGLALFLLVSQLAIRVCLLVALAICGKGILTVYWAVAMSRLQGLGAAAGLAYINMIGLVGAFLGPYLYGLAETSWGRASAGCAVAIASSICGLLLVPLLHRALRSVDMRVVAVEPGSLPA